MNTRWFNNIMCYNYINIFIYFRLKNTIMKYLPSLQHHLSWQTEIHRQQHHQISHHQIPLNHQHPVFRVGLVDLPTTNWGIHCNQCVHMIQYNFGIKGTYYTIVLKNAGTRHYQQLVNELYCW